MDPNTKNENKPEEDENKIDPNQWFKDESVSDTPQPTDNLPSSGQAPAPNGLNQTDPYVATNQPEKPVSKFGKTKKLAIFSVLAIVLLGGGSAAAFFGVYVPNKPENVWSKALQNTGHGYDKAIKYAETKKESKGGKLIGNFNFESGEFVGDGTIDSKYYDKNSESKITVGVAGTRFEMDVLSNLTDRAKNPDLYVKVSGLKGIDQLLGAGLGGIGSSVSSLENQWFVVDHTLLDQYDKSLSQADTGSITVADATNTAKIVGEVSKEYVLTDDPSKAVFVVKENVGKENVDGRSVYHYKVGINKENLKTYNNAMCDRLLEDKVYKSFSSGATADQRKKECYDTTDIDKINESDTYDVWVDMKTKLIRTVRIYEKDKKDSFFDIGLLYNGGDEYPFSFKFASKDENGEGKGEFKINLNQKADKVTLDAWAEGIENGHPLKYSLNATIEPSDEQIKFTKPKGAKSLLEAYSSLISGISGIPTGGEAVPSQALINKCLQETTPSPKCQALYR